jgi:hypothetical protein
MVLSEPWMQAANIARGADGKPENGPSSVVFAATFLLQLIVAGMMRHVFSLSGIDTGGAGLIAGFGIGLFFIAPWIAINNLYGQRPAKLSVIDGSYATLACSIMGCVLTLL